MTVWAEGWEKDSLRGCDRVEISGIKKESARGAGAQVASAERELET